MSDNISEPNGGVPPKLDLKKAGVLKGSAPAGSPDNVSEVVQIKTPQIKPAEKAPTVKLQPKPVPLASPVAPAKPSAPSTGVARPTLKPASASGGAVPKLSPAQKPASVVNAPAPVAQPQEAKSQTSKIPLDVAIAAAKEKKKETSRIALEAAGQSAQGIEKAPTGKLAKPPLAATAGQPVKPIQITPSVPKAPVSDAATVKLTKKPTDDEKRRTSRISLEAALVSPAGDKDGAADAGMPKTIKLKRPSEAPTIKAVSRIPSPTGAKPAVTAEDKIGSTQRVDVPEADATPTSRKTIKVKRPSARPTVKGGMTIKKSAPKKGKVGAPGQEAEPEEGAPAVAAKVVDFPTKVDSPHVAFHIVAVFAIIVLCVTIYMFCAQVLGPNACYTQYSYYKEGPNLGWMNKMPVGY